jgi:hypothetical protein
MEDQMEDVVVVLSKNLTISDLQVEYQAMYQEIQRSFE